jgi:hypothetical protein
MQLMNRLRILGLSLVAAFALGAVIANASLAGEEGLLPPESFTIKGGTQAPTSLNNEKLECMSVEGSGKFSAVANKDSHAEGTLTFHGCKSLGFPASTLGAASETMIVKVLYLICLTNHEKLQWGMLVEPTEVPTHVEVPAPKALLLVKGAMIGLLLDKLKGVNLEKEPTTKEFALAIAEVPAINRLKCLLNGVGEWEASYDASLDTKADIDAFYKGEDDVTFAAAVTFMDK